jgi:hypothetical protein
MKTRKSKPILELLTPETEIKYKERKKPRKTPSYMVNLEFYLLFLV